MLSGLRSVLNKKPVLVASDLAIHPIEAWTRIQDTFIDRRERRGPQFRYETDLNWERWLHDSLSVEWPCQLTSEFYALWPEVIKEVAAKGIRLGPECFKYWNDGDAGLVRSIWCVVRHLAPDKVVETGVGHGVTSRIILEAMKKNGRGHLWSIDLPPLEKAWQKQVGIAVGDGHRDRWSYIRGSSRLHLPKLLAKVGELDLFIHDSLHSERNVRFELDRAWTVLRPGGALVVDDIDVNWGFRSFTQTFSGQRSVICQAEPLHPDLRRPDKKGMFGIIVKDSPAQFELESRTA
ncbi:MAG: class I SAM-dependent methyltransferase [Candidatus Sulfotelmatobacter sp.]